MSSVSVVVVIVGVVVAIAVMTIGDGKPATPPAPPDDGPFEPGFEPAFPAPEARWVPPAIEAHVDLDPGPGDVVRRRRLRSLVLLGVTILVIGSAAAALLGATALLGARFLDKALG